MDSVTILLSTYNGELYLEELLNSIFRQEEVIIRLFVRDDGSTDSTVDIIHNFISNGYDIRLITGNNLGAKRSFYELLKLVEKSTYYAFCDQDDYWKPRKIIEAINCIKQKEGNGKIPILYYSELEQVDKGLKKIKKQRICGEAYSLGEILVKNHAYGCTMVFNDKLKDLFHIVEGGKARLLPYHDHWMYIICRLNGGEIVYDQNANILYRQHEENVIGSRMKRVDIFKKSGIFDKECTRYHRAILLRDMYGESISDENKEVLNIICEYKENSYKKMRLILNAEIKPQSLCEKVVFVLLVFLNRF